MLLSHTIMKNITDISSQKSPLRSTIDQVGIRNLEIPLKIQWNKTVQTALASIQATVSMDNSEQRGIHMSRIYSSLHEFSEKEVLSFKTMKELLKKIVQRQNNSASGELKISWKSSVQRKALKTDMKGWHAYPCFYKMSLKNDSWVQTAGISIFYSSTCPCSAALSRKLIQDQFQKDQPQPSEMMDWLGQETSIAGVPHSQRSVAHIQVQTQKENTLPSLIDDIESTLKTATQVAVKRQDESYFAHLNSQNLMYSEDAIRRIKNVLENRDDCEDYHARIYHMESLHPFDIVAEVSKKGQ